MPDVILRRALADDRPALERLYQLYVHDLSEFRGTMPGADGVYVPGHFAERLATPGLVAYRTESAGRLAGFVMVRPHEGRSLMAEFFVVRGARRAGVGAAAARAALAHAPGPWSIPFQEENPGAARFWRRIATSVAGRAWTERRVPVPGRPSLPPDVWLDLDVPRPA